jgi:hypothetical protein
MIRELLGQFGGVFRGIESFSADENEVRKSEEGRGRGEREEIRNTHERSLGWPNTCCCLTLTALSAQQRRPICTADYAMCCIASR